MLTITASDWLEICVETKLLKRNLRKGDLVPMYRPKGYIDPWPRCDLDQVVAVRMDGSEIIVTGLYIGRVTPQPFICEVNGEKKRFEPTGTWDIGPATTKLSGIHYQDMQP